MKYKTLILLVPLALTLNACGSSDSPSANEIDAPIIDNAGMAGMVFAAVDVDPSIRQSHIYYYEFAKGKVRDLLPVESVNPALFFADGKVFLFNRQSDAQNFRVFDPRTEAPIPDAIPLPTLTAGDPWDVAVVEAGKSLVLASPLGEALDILNYQTGDLAEVVLPSNLASKTIRPHGLMRSGNHVLVLHSGTDANGTSDDSQAIYDTQAIGGTLTFTDDDHSSTQIDGQALTGSNPTGFLNRDGAGGATILGLCAKDWTGCTAGSDRLNSMHVEKASLLPEATFPYYYWNQVVDGPAANFVFAEVRDASGAYSVIKVDVEAKTASAVHEFATDRLFGTAFDQGSRTLFIGGQDGIKGKVLMYRDNQYVNAFEIDGILYSAAFVPK